MSNELISSIGKLLHKARIKKSLTQAEVAKRAGINANTYAKIERGDQSPNVETLGKIVKALGVKSSDVLPF